MNQGKVVSGFVALGIYLGLIFLVLYFYNIHQTKLKKFAEKPLDRVTVTLVNSDKTVFNKSSTKSNHIKPSLPIVPIPLKQVHKPVSKRHIVKQKSTPKRHRVKKHIPKKVVKPKAIVKKHRAKKHIPKKVVKPKASVKKHRVKKHIPKKVVKPKAIVKKHRVKKDIPKKVVKPKAIVKKHTVKKNIPKKSAKELFSSIKTKDVTKQPSKRRPKPLKHQVVKLPSRVKHNSSIADRIKNTHQSGRVSNANRDKGVKNGYISKVKRHMNNWNANPAYKGKRVSLALTIYSSGKFSYRILSGGDGNMRKSLSRFLDRLNKMGQLGRHSKSKPYSIRVNFIVR